MDRNRARLSIIQNEIRSLKHQLTMASIGEPSEPIIFGANAISQQSVQHFVEKHRVWADERLALRRELFALQDQEYAITASDTYRAYSSPLSELTVEIAAHNIRKPSDDILALIGDPDVRRYQRAVRAVRLEHWLAEAEMLEGRRQKLSAAATAGTPRPTANVSESADVVKGPWRFVRCVDGDTIEVAIDNNGPAETVRLLNINTPEEGQVGYYHATLALKEMLENRTIDLEFEKPGEPTRDRYGRVLAFVFVNDKLVNYEMIRKGWSDFYTDYGRGRYALPMEFAESDARARRQGLHR